ncbi:MAG TPA: Mth938-like domain-containing protein [Rhodanobacteraceae bacterium]|nr:Mth938-like domain-containing protein [Rhodanobacteraceae bacterium]
MELTRDRPEGYLFVRACTSDSVTVVDRELRRSFVITPERVIEDWPVENAAQLDGSAIETILDLAPEVILLGTGEHQRFPARDLLAGVLRRGVGVEVMDNAAAGRTYNVLAAEGRRVAAAFMLRDETPIESSGG